MERGAIGVRLGVSTKHSRPYLDEDMFRYNNKTDE
jgi:hypothetical protein